MQRRAMLIAGVATTLGTGCASRSKDAGPPSSYKEKIESLAATKDWRKIIVFGERFDYELVPSKALVALLTGPSHARLAGNFQNARLHKDNSLELDVRLIETTQRDMTFEEYERSTRPMRAMRVSREMLIEEFERAPLERRQISEQRVVFDERLTFQRYLRTEVDKSKLGLQPTNQAYVIDIAGDAPEPYKPSIAKTVLQGAGLIVLIPIFLVFVLLTQKGMPLR